MTFFPLIHGQCLSDQGVVEASFQKDLVQMGEGNSPRALATILRIASTTLPWRRPLPPNPPNQRHHQGHHSLTRVFPTLRRTIPPHANRVFPAGCPKPVNNRISPRRPKARTPMESNSPKDHPSGPSGLSLGTPRKIAGVKRGGVLRSRRRESGGGPVTQSFSQTLFSI